MKQNSEIICSFDMLCAHAFCMCLKSLCAPYAHA